MPTTPERQPERERGSIWKLQHELRQRPRDFESGIRVDLWQAPADRKSQASEVRTNVYEMIEPVFPSRLRKQAEHRMNAPELCSELSMILDMADIKDPNASVVIYSLQVNEPQNLGNQLTKMVLDLLPRNLTEEIMNGYFRHELLYGLREPAKSFVLVSAIQNARRITVSLKPPWSPYRTNVLITLG